MKTSSRCSMAKGSTVAPVCSYNFANVYNASECVSGSCSSLRSRCSAPLIYPFSRPARTLMPPNLAHVSKFAQFINSYTPIRKRLKDRVNQAPLTKLPAFPANERSFVEVSFGLYTARDTAVGWGRAPDSWLLVRICCTAHQTFIKAFIPFGLVKWYSTCVGRKKHGLAYELTASPSMDRIDYNSSFIRPIERLGGLAGVIPETRTSNRGARDSLRLLRPSTPPIMLNFFVLVQFKNRLKSEHTPIFYYYN